MGRGDGARTRGQPPTKGTREVPGLSSVVAVVGCFADSLPPLTAHVSEGIEIEAPLTESHQRLEALEAEARYASERYRLYRARVSGPQPTSTDRLRALQREAEFAEKTLARARAVPTPTTMTKENDAIDRH